MIDIYNLTKAEIIDEHRKMWRWIAEETRRQKRCVMEQDYIIHAFPCRSVRDTLYEYHCCFCCIYAGGYDCNGCPIDWNSTASHHMCQFRDESEIKILFTTDSTGYFSKWQIAKTHKDYEAAAWFADIIANLPENEEVE